MSVVRHTVYNLTGAIGSLLIVLVTVPFYLERIGAVRYGILAIVWMILGYFGLFNLGLTRATTHRIAQLADGREREEVFWTAVVLNAALGFAGGLILYGAGLFLVGPVLTLAPALVHQIQVSLPYLALAVPLSTTTSVLTGALEARERFGTVNLVQLAGSFLYYVTPLLAAYFWSPALDVLIPVTVAARAVSVLFFIPPLIRALPLRHAPRLHTGQALRLFRYGFWITLTDIIGPLLTTIDRLVIGALDGAAAVTFYVIPSNLASRGSILASSLSRALFPHLSAAEPAVARATAVRAVMELNGLMTPFVLLGIFLMHPFLALWISPAFAIQAAPVGEIFLLGIWVNALAFIPFTLIQAMGRPDLTARFHLLELVPYLALLWFGLVEYGLPGAAVAWVLRVGADTVLLFGFSGLLVRPVVIRLVPFFLLVAGGGFLRVWLPPASRLRLGVEAGWFLMATGCAFVTSEWLRSFLKSLPIALRTTLGRLRAARSSE